MTTRESEQNPNEPNQKFLQKPLLDHIKRSLVRGTQFAGLTWEDLARYNNLPDSTMEQYIARILQAHKSILPEVALRLIHVLTRAVQQNNDVYGLLLDNQEERFPSFTTEDEIALREHVLQEEKERKHDPLLVFYSKAHSTLCYMNQLAYFSLLPKKSHPFYARSHDDQTAVMYKVVFQVPELRVVDGSLQFVLKLPSRDGASEAELDFLSMFPQAQTEFVITDPKMSTSMCYEILKSHTLFSLILANEIRNEQEASLHALRETCIQTAMKKFDETDGEVVRMNLPVRTHFIRLLQQHVVAHGKTQFSVVYRSKENESAILDSSVPQETEGQDTGYVRTYTASASSNSKVMLTWNDMKRGKRNHNTVLASVLHDEVDGDTVIVQTKDMEKDDEYVVLDGPNSQEHRLEHEIDAFLALTSDIRVTTTPKYLEEDETYRNQVQFFASQLCHCHDLITFFQELRSLTTLFPSVEFVLSTYRGKMPYTRLREVPPPPQSVGVLSNN